MKKSAKKLIVFDLDETLIHATKDKLDLQEDFKHEGFFVYKRPFVDSFLKECSKLFSIAIWSSADDEYVSKIAEQLIPKDIEMEFVWGRSSCWLKVIKIKNEEIGEITRKEHQYIKPLEKVRRKGFKMKNLIIVDDSLFKVTDNPDNYIIVNPFKGDTKDVELKNLLSYLNRIADEEDLSKVKTKNWKEV